MSETLEIPAGEASLAVRIDGEAGKPWLLLSNSLAADMTMWDPQVAKLSAHRRLVRYDTRGHGRSSAPAGPYSFDQLVDDMIAILDHLGIETADVLGLSLGGMTALGLGLTHPERVRKLVCCDARSEFPPAAIAGWDQRMSAVAAGGVSSIADETLTRWFVPATFRDRPEVIEQARRMILSTSSAGYLGCVAALKTLNYRERLPRLEKHTLFVVGEDDLAAPPSVMREMAAATPRAEFVTISGAAHIANMEGGATFDAAICSFLLADDFDDELWCL
jgi:3-oxoadipate enol-lactonase